MEDLVIKLLFDGKTQPEISAYLKEQNIKPNSLSSIEKLLKKLKDKYKANTLFHLAIILSKKRKI